MTQIGWIYKIIKSDPVNQFNLHRTLRRHLRSYLAYHAGADGRAP